MADMLPRKRPAPHAGPEMRTTTTSSSSSSTADDRSDRPASRAKKARTGPDDDRAAAAEKTPMQTLHDKAVRLLDAGRTAEAFTTFRAALVYCTCQRAARRQFRAAGVPLEAIDPLGHCSCKDFVAAAQTRRQRAGLALTPPSSPSYSVSDLDLAAVYNLTAAVTPCTCGSGRARCRAAGHLAVLDRLAVAAVRLGRAAPARAAAQWYLDLAPERAHGYLHLAKAVLLGERGEQGDAATRRFAVRCLYHHGLHNVRQHGAGSDPGGRMAALLARCCAQYGAGDYLPGLPVETAEMVFQHLALGDLVRCCRVSRAWAAMLTRLRLRLRLVKLAGARGGRGNSSNGAMLLRRLFRRLPGLQATNLFLGSGPAVTATATTSTAAMRSSQAALVVEALQRFPSVEMLALNAHELLGTAGGQLPPSLCPPGALGRCQRLVLGGLSQDNLAPLLGLVQSVQATVETLELQANGPFEGRVAFSLPKLTCLRTDGVMWDGGLFLPSLCMQAPALRHLYMDNMGILTNNRALEQLPGYDPAAVFQNLHSFVLGPNITPIEPFHRADTLPSSFPVLPDAIRCIDLLSDSPRVADLFLVQPRCEPFSSSSTGDDHMPAPPFPAHGRPLRPFARLEAFRCRADMADGRTPACCLLDLLGPSLDPLAGRLAHLELCGRGLEQAFAASPRFAVPAPARLRSVGLLRVDWGQAYRHIPGHVVGRTYVQWLAQFAGATALTVDPELTPEQADALLVSVVEQRVAAFRAAAGPAGAAADGPPPPPALTVYHTVRRPGLTARLRRLIGEHPIAVVDVVDYRPPVFPWPDDEAQA